MAVDRRRVVRDRCSPGVAAAVVTASQRRWVRKHRVDILIVTAFVSLFVVVIWVRHTNSQLAHRNCLAIENLKAGQRDQAQATVNGDNLLLFRHAKFGDPLPVPREAVIGDRNAKLKTVHRYPARECPKP